MNWKAIIQELLDQGMTQAEIAHGIGLKQPSIAELLSGRTKEMMWRTGDRLIKLHHRKRAVYSRRNASINHRAA